MKTQEFLFLKDFAYFSVFLFSPILEEKGVITVHVVGGKAAVSFQSAQYFGSVSFADYNFAERDKVHNTEGM